METAKHWIKEGYAILDSKYYKLWADCVPIRLDDLYEGMELGACLDIVKVLNKGGSFEDAEVILRSQGHSGMSHGLVCAMIRSFCERGSEFVAYLKTK